MRNIEDEQQVFRIGTQVEISSNEKGFKNCWYKCTIIDPPESHNMQKRRKRKKFYWVEYQSIVEEQDQSKALREYVEASFIRPLPPTAHSACSTNFQMFDVVDANYRDGWWIGVVIKVMNDGMEYLVAFVNPYEKIVFSRDKLRPHLSWLGGDQWIRLPIKNDLKCPQDRPTSVRASQVESIIAQVKSSAKRLKQASNDVASSALLQSCRQSLSEGNTAIINPQCATQNPSTVLNRKITDCVNSVMADTDLSTTPSLNISDPDRGVTANRKKIQRWNNNKTDVRSYAKETRDYLANKPVQRVLRFLQHVEEPGESDSNITHVVEEPGESDSMHESAIDPSPTSDAAGSSRSFTKEVQITEISDAINGVEEVNDEQGFCKACVLHSNPTLTECSDPHSATSGVNSLSDKSHNWPFTKRSEMWKVIESMEVFKRIPQTPHFFPLNIQGENWREMFAICMMMKFAYEVERVTAGSLFDRKNANIIHESLRNLKELELHGFSTSVLQVYLKELLKNIGTEKELQEKLEEAESGMRKFKVEKTEAERMSSEIVEQIKFLQEHIKYTESLKYRKEQTLVKLESMKGIIASELHRLRLAKKRPPMAW